MYEKNFKAELQDFNWAEVIRPSFSYCPAVVYKAGI